MAVQKIEFEGGNGARLAVKVELPGVDPISYAIFACNFAYQNIN